VSPPPRPGDTGGPSTGSGSRFLEVGRSNGRHFGKFSNGHISETVRPIRFVFGSRVKV